MKRLLKVILLCLTIFCLSSCEKIGDDESDSTGTGGRPISSDGRGYIHCPVNNDRGYILMG